MAAFYKIPEISENRLCVLNNSTNHYKEKYNQMKNLYEFEKVNARKEIDSLTQENYKLAQKLDDLKSGHYAEVSKLKEQVEEYASKIEFYEEVIKTERLRADSAIDENSRLNTESKTGESTIESDKLTNILKSKEDHIRKLMQELRESNSNEDTPKTETESVPNQMHLEYENNRLTNLVLKLKRELELANHKIDSLSNNCSTYREIDKNIAAMHNFPYKNKNKEQTPEF